MSTKDERRSVELAFIMPGSPDQVWKAIATGPGISAWFVPTEVEEREGGTIGFNLGPELESKGSVTRWQPPHRFAYEEHGWSEGAPPLATELTVEALSGDQCRVRLVHSLFTSSEQWDNELESMKKGWPPFFEVMRVYLREFDGQGVSSVRLMRTSSSTLSEAEVWQTFLTSVGAADKDAGQELSIDCGAAPALRGMVEPRAKGKGNHLLLRVHSPAPGVALFGAGTWEGKVHIAGSLFFYGASATTVVEHEPGWSRWFAAVHMDR